MGHFSNRWPGPLRSFSSSSVIRAASGVTSRVLSVLILLPLPMSWVYSVLKNKGNKIKQRLALDYKHLFYTFSMTISCRGRLQFLLLGV